MLCILGLTACEGPDPTPAVNAKFAKTLLTSESGDKATITLTLNSEPTSNVSIAIHSSDTTEGMVEPGQVIFTPSNWKSPKTVFIIGQDDNMEDGDMRYIVAIDGAISNDKNYKGLGAVNIPAVNIDNEGLGNPPNKPASILVTPQQIQTSEDGQSAQITVALSQAPAADSEVHIDIASSNDNEGKTDSPAGLTFTASDWSDRTFTVTGQDDAIVDGNVAYQINLSVAASSDSGHLPIDPAFSNVTITPVSAINIDNESTPTPTLVFDYNVDPSYNSALGLQTSEDGKQAKVNISLSAKPNDRVVLNIVSSNSNEGSVSPSQLTFDASNFALPQLLTISGQNDSVIDGNQAYSVDIDPSSSADSGYAILGTTTLSLVNLDNDPEPNPGVSVSLLDGNSDENGGSGQISLALGAVPSQPVTIKLNSSLPQEGIAIPDTITFDSNNWRNTQTVDIVGQDDDIVDGTVSYDILFSVSSGDSRYDGISVATQSLLNADNESAGVVVTPVAGITTSEAGTSADIMIALSAKPIANDNVVITATVGNPAEGSISPAALSFNQSNWNTAQAFTVTGVSDNLVDGNITYNISFSVTAASNNPYNNLAIAPYPVTNIDTTVAATPGVMVNAANPLLTSESGASASFTVQLQSQPSAPVTISAVSSNSAEGVVSPASIQITSDSGGATSWNSAQTFTVTGQDDAVVDGNINYQITFTVSSGDSNYAGMSVAALNVVNQDNEVADIVVNPESNLQTSESGASVSVNVSLTAPPPPGVTVNVNASSQNSNEGVVNAPATISFSNADWNIPQTITITGQDDTIVDGDVVYSVAWSISATAPANPYNSATHAALQITNLDNDQPLPTISVTAVNPLQTGEDGTFDSFTVVLNSAPAGDVTIAANSSNPLEGVVTPASLTFSGGVNSNWQTPQTFTVTGQDDLRADGAVSYSINFNVTGAQTPASINAVNQDNDIADVVINASGNQTSEAGNSVSLALHLVSQPTIGSTITLTANSDNSAEASVSPASVSFNDSDWNSDKTITVSGVNDDIADGDVNYAIQYSVTANSATNPYHGISLSPLALTNIDNDFIRVTSLPGQVSDSSGHSVSLLVQLLQPTASDIRLSASSSDISAAKVYPREPLTDQPLALIFSPSSALDQAQVIRLVGQPLAPASPLTYQVNFSVDSNGASNTPVQVPATMSFQQVASAPAPPATDAVFNRYIEPSGNSDIDPLNPKFKFMANDGTMVEATAIETIADNQGPTNLLSGSPLLVNEGQNIHWQLVNDHLVPHHIKIYHLFQDVLQGGEAGEYHFSAPAAGSYLIGSNVSTEQAMGVVSALIVKPTQANTAWTGGPSYSQGQDITWLITDMDSTWIGVKVNTSDPAPVANANFAPDVQLVNGRNGSQRTDANDTRLVKPNGAGSFVFLIRVLNAGSMTNTIEFPNPGNSGVKEISRNGIHQPNIASLPFVDTVNIGPNETIMLLYEVPTSLAQNLGGYPILIHNQWINPNYNLGNFQDTNPNNKYAYDRISVLEIQ